MLFDRLHETLNIAWSIGLFVDPTVHIYATLFPSLCGSVGSVFCIDLYRCLMTKKVTRQYIGRRSEAEKLADAERVDL